MAKRTIYTCDRCGADMEEDEALHVRAVTGQHRDGGPGLDLVDETTRVDLCPKCAEVALQGLLNDLSFDEAQEWVDEWYPQS